jgi:aminoglycoside/choline kinase family phosphotransferase
MTPSDKITNSLIPDGIKPTTLEFLQEAVGSENYQILALAGDASTRRYFRIVQDPRTFVLMVWEPFESAENYPFLNIQRHFLANGIAVPEVIKISAELGLVLLEDLGDLTLERKFWENQNQSDAWPYYEQSLDELLKIHFRATADYDPQCSAFKLMFDTEKLLWEMNYGREHLIEKFLKIHLSKAESDGLQALFVKICESLHQEPKVVCHRDYHSRNVMIKFGKARVIDFQDARLGPIQYDLVSLLQDSYVNLSSESRQHLLDYYLVSAKKLLPKDFSQSHFNEMYRLQVIQRSFKACGSFASFYNLRGDRRYLKYLPGSLRTIAAQLREMKDYHLFLKILEDHGLLDRSFEP